MIMTLFIITTMVIQLKIIIYLFPVLNVKDSPKSSVRNPEMFYAYKGFPIHVPNIYYTHINMYVCECILQLNKIFALWLCRLAHLPLL